MRFRFWVQTVVPGKGFSGTSVESYRFRFLKHGSGGSGSVPTVPVSGSSSVSGPSCILAQDKGEMTT